MLKIYIYIGEWGESSFDFTSRLKISYKFHRRNFFQPKKCVTWFFSIIKFVQTSISAWKTRYKKKKRCEEFLTLFTVDFFGFFLAFLACVVIKISKTKNNLSMKLSSQKHISFVFIVCLFWCLVCVTWCDYDATSITTPCKLCKLDIYLFTKNHLELFTLVKFMYY